MKKSLLISTNNSVLSGTVEECVEVGSEDRAGESTRVDNNTKKTSNASSVSVSSDDSSSYETDLRRQQQKRKTNNRSDNHVKSEDPLVDKDHQEDNTAITSATNTMYRNNNNATVTPKKLPTQASTPKLRQKQLVAKSSELIKEFAPPPIAAMEYSYYVIASPAVGRRVSSDITSNNHNNTNMTSRSYSFVSLSSKDSSSSELSTVVHQPAKRAPKSRGLLQSVKEKLMAEIENINIELIKMDSEKVVLVNLRNASMLYRDMVCKSERNNQGIPNASKLRATCESIELKIQDEEHALQDDLAIPNIEEIRKDLKEVVKICNIITKNNSKATSIKMTLVEELLCSVGRLYGVVDTILVIFYEDLNEHHETADSTVNISGDDQELPADDDGDATGEDTVDSGVESNKESPGTSPPPPDLNVSYKFIVRLSKKVLPFSLVLSKIVPRDQLSDAISIG